jgi:hypothetical protein
MTPHRIATSAALLSLAALLGMVGCVNPPMKHTSSETPGAVSLPPGYRPLTTPVAPIANVERAYAERSSQALAVYETLLDPARFTHLTDMAGPRSPRVCDYACDVRATDSLFASSAVQSLALKLIANPSDTLKPAASDMPDAPPGTMQFSLNGSSLAIETGTNAELHQYVRSVIDVAPFGEGGAKAWRIVRWHDVLPLLDPERR